MPRSSEMRRISSMLGAATVAICGLLSSVRVNIAPARPAADGGFLQPGGPGCVECGRLGRVLELDELDGDLDHQPVVPAQVESGQLHDPAEPLAERVRVDVERVGGGDDVAEPPEDLLL